MPYWYCGRDSPIQALMGPRFRLALPKGETTGIRVEGGVGRYRGRLSVAHFAVQNVAEAGWKAKIGVEAALTSGRAGPVLFSPSHNRRPGFALRKQSAPALIDGAFFVPAVSTAGHVGAPSGAPLLCAVVQTLRGPPPSPVLQRPGGGPSARHGETAMTHHLPAHVTFEGIDLTVIDRGGRPWISTADLARALGYGRADKISLIYLKSAQRRVHTRE